MAPNAIWATAARRVAWLRLAAGRGGGGRDGVHADQQCEVASMAATAADAARARAACETARARFVQLFGEPVPAVRIVLWDRPGYRTGTIGDRAAIFWPTAAAMVERARGAGAAATAHYISDQWRNVLPHETMHALLAARFDVDQSSGTAASYGTPFPDWFDEGVAIWAEPLEHRRARLAQARALPEARRDLRAILTATHPAAGTAAVPAIRDGAGPPPNEALWAFYPQAIAVVTFVYNAGGKAALRELARRFIARPAAAYAIADLPGLPADFAGVVAAWETWLGRPAGRAAQNAERASDR